MPVVSNIEYKDWKNFVNSHPGGNIYQCPEMFDFYLRINKYEPIKIFHIDKSGNVDGVLLGAIIYEKNKLVKLFSSRAVVFGGPLISDKAIDIANILDRLLVELIRITRKKALFIQLRNFFDWEEYLPVFEKFGFSWIDRLNYIIRIQYSESSIQNPGSINLSATRRRQIKKALANGAEIIEPQSIEQVREFYNILYKLYRYKVRKPLPDWSFFKSFYDLASTKPDTTRNPVSGTRHPLHTTRHPVSGTRNPIGIIRLIKYNGRIIGGILSPILPGRCIYEWYVCGLDKEYKQQYPSVLATWAAIEYAMENGISTFDFMGVGKPDEDYGVRDFKARFGGEMVNYGRFTRINNKFLFNIAEFGYNVLALFKKI